MTKLDALIAGVKTSIVTFLMGLVAIAIGATNALISALSTGNPPDLSFVKGAAFALITALAVGVLNSIMRLLQTVDLPFVTSLINKVLGKVPSYSAPRADGNFGDRGAIDGGGLVLALICFVLGFLCGRLL